MPPPAHDSKTAESPRAGGPPAPVEAVEYGADEGGLDLRELAGTLSRGRWVIVGTALAGALLLGVYSFLVPSRYQSYALLLVETEEQGLSSILPAGAAGAAGALGILPAERGLGNELLVLRESYRLAEAVAEDLVRAGRVPGTRRPLTILEPKDGEPVSVQDVAFRLQEDYVASSEENGADALRVSVESTVPEEAAYIANLYAEAFQTLTRESSRADFATSREFLEGQVEVKGQELAELDDELQAYMEQEGAVALDEASTQIVQQIGELQAQRDRVGVEIGVRQASINALQSELRRLEPRLAERLGSGLDAELNAAQGRLVELQGQLDVFYTENPQLRQAPDPGARVRQLQTEIARVRRRISEISGQLADQSLAAASGPGAELAGAGFARAAELRARLANERVDLSGLVAQRSRLSVRLAEYERDLQRIPDQSIGLAQLQRERVSRERLYGALEANLEEARLAEQSQLGRAEVIRPAFVPERPFTPVLPLNVALGAVLGLMGGALFAIGRERLGRHPERSREGRTGLDSEGSGPPWSNVGSLGDGSDPLAS